MPRFGVSPVERAVAIPRGAPRSLVVEGASSRAGRARRRGSRDESSRVESTDSAGLPVGRSASGPPRPAVILCWLPTHQGQASPATCARHGPASPPRRRTRERMGRAWACE